MRCNADRTSYFATTSDAIEPRPARCRRRAAPGSTVCRYCAAPQLKALIAQQGTLTAEIARLQNALARVDEQIRTTHE